jgi:hypothetical protein
MFEDQFDTVITQFIELEIAIATTSFRLSLRSIPDIFLMERERTSITRIHIPSFLSSMKAYFDQSCHFLNDMHEYKAKDSSFIDLFRSTYRSEHKSNFSYRLMDQLRNHIQHRSLPFMLTVSMNRANDEGENYIESIPIVIISQLKENKRVSSNFLKEISNIKYNFDFYEHSKKFMNSLYKIHFTVRNSTNSKVSDWEQFLESIEQRLSDHYSKKDFIHFVASVVDKNDTVIDRIEVSNVLIERRKLLEESNRMISDVTKRVISNKRRYTEKLM